MPSPSEEHNVCVLCEVSTYLSHVCMRHAYKAGVCSMGHVKAERMKLTVNGLVQTDELRVCMACCLILSR